MGYGDFNITTTLEKAFCTTVKIIGVFAFSFASGILATILLDFDNQNGLLKQQMLVLNQVKSEYKIPPILYQNLKNSLDYQAKNDFQDVFRFLESLPQKLKVDLSVYIYKEIYEKFDLIKN